MKIPFLDLAKQHCELKEELVAVFSDILTSGRFAGGPVVEKFETEFAAFCNTHHCVGVGSGTDALRFALIAAGVEPDSIVLTVPNTFIATTEAISQAGAIPDFVDIDEKTYTIDCERLREYLQRECDLNTITGRPVHRLKKRPVSAIIPVHLYGQMADMDSILDIAHTNNLIVIEDACQAHGAQYYSARNSQWETAGSMGVAAAFSFYPGKNLGACGEAGALTTNSEDIARKVRMLRDHGQPQKYYHDIEGYNGRLDALQAGILSVKLSHLKDWTAKRRQAAAWYHEMLGDIYGVITPLEAERCRSVYHLYVLRTTLRDELMNYLKENGVDTGLHYPIPLHKQNAYKMKVFSHSKYPISEKVSSEILSLPMYPELSREEISYIVHLIHDFFLEQTDILKPKTTPEVPFQKDFNIPQGRLNNQGRRIYES
ncbi:MAG TPA: DegT/DnrJ/EryC1/StrS family aminotransferase [Deltaproteobacteria bacterium]|nr:DegT/DnrJ/EryC1/StrS family aminotransferase [Deltaproteobacteria bacterium]HPR52039.1 DegT/DnrJ/EryC1/StrS family aminotransferase [Deltaproteobacteria bacterium]